MLVVRELLRNDLLAKSFGLLELPEAYSLTELERHLSQGDLVLGLLKDSEVVGFAPLGHHFVTLILWGEVNLIYDYAQPLRVGLNQLNHLQILGRRLIPSGVDNENNARKVSSLGDIE